MLKVTQGTRSYQLEEEGRLIGLQSGLGVDRSGRAESVILGGEGGCRRELLDELHHWVSVVGLEIGHLGA
jgi:hypothetical protein